MSGTPLSFTLGIAGRKFRGGLPCTVRLRHSVAAKAVCVFAAMRLRHARGKLGVFSTLGAPRTTQAADSVFWERPARLLAFLSVHFLG